VESEVVPRARASMGRSTSTTDEARLRDVGIGGELGVAGAEFLTEEGRDEAGELLVGD
jgi:hypothetical protein